MTLINTEWLENNLDKVKIIDCSWHMPNVNRDSYKEYIKEHIKDAIYFDLEKNSDQNTDLPHMLTDKISWEKIMSLMGISNEDKIVIYDNSDVISSCRLWYNLIYFGHSYENVHVLDGGLKKWKIENRKLTNSITKIMTTNYQANEIKEFVKNKKEINDNISRNDFKIIDARSRERFEGKVVEPRKGLRSGSIPKSLCLPYKELINDDNTFKNKNDILNIFKDILGQELTTNVIFSCGSGITASVLALAYSLINNKYMPVIYDGSWAEYGKI
jgi:thiosulfate/3-mercaptopyruvate sulfurtransferase